MGFYAHKLVLVTGASEGIGFAVVQVLLVAGADVVFTSRQQPKLLSALQTLHQFRTRPQQKLAFKAFDVSNATDCTKKISEIVQEFGVPDVVINCAGLARPAYLIDEKLTDFDDMLQTNLVGIVNVCRAIVPHLIAAKKGHIINTSSIAGFVGLFGYTGYCASKYAVIGFSEALRRELKPYGVHVSVLCPPNTQTPGLTRENLNKPTEVLQTEEKIKPVSANFVAQYLLRNIPKRKFYLIPTFDGRLTHFISRHLPFVLDWFVKRPNTP